MSLLIGDSYGQIHLVDLYNKQIVKTYGKLAKNAKVNHIDRLENQDQAYSIFSTNNSINIYNLSNQQSNQSGLVFSHLTVPQEKIVGIEIYQSTIVYSLNIGKIQLMNWKEQQHASELLYQIDFKKGEIQRGLRSKFKYQQYLMIGKDVLPFIVDLTKQTPIWTGKNVPNDFLQLRVPINDVDATFYNIGNNLAIVNSDRKVRLFDIKKGQKKPIFDKQFNDEKGKFTKITESKCQNYFYVATASGSIFQLDKRKELHNIGKLKGANGCIKGMQISQSGQNLVSGSLDQYIRLYDLNTNKQIYKMYTSQAICSLMINEQIDIQRLNEQQQNREEVKQKIKAPKRKNTIALPYLKPRKLIKQQQAQ